jgi:glyoxylase-like metal-dependent hydrolase (beta-lactamase superfamily II)
VLALGRAVLRVLLTGGLVAFLLSAARAVPVTVSMTPIKVGPHSWYVQGSAGEASHENQGFMSNAGFVVTGDGVVVFDSLGSPPLAEKLIEEIHAITPLPIRRVIVSHYHADHVYGLQAFKAIGAEIWARREAEIYLKSDLAQQRLQQRRDVLAPWVDASTHLVPPDRWLDHDQSFSMGGLTFRLVHVGPAHTPEDLAMMVEPDGVLYSGDVVFAGRIPYVGDADSRLWLTAIDRLQAFHAKVMVPGHGPASFDPPADIALTRDYLLYLRKTMGAAAADLVSFDEAYARTDWRAFEKYPAFAVANRANAYNTYLLLQAESLAH